MTEKDTPRVRERQGGHSEREQAEREHRDTPNRDNRGNRIQETD